MKTLTSAALAVCLLASAAPALAAATPKAVEAAAPAAMAIRAVKTLSTETASIAEIAASPEGKLALEAHIPGITTHEAYDEFKTMTLKALLPMSDGAVTDEKIEAIQADLDKIGK